MPKKILITEKIADEGIEILRGRGYICEVELGLDHDQLIEKIGDYDALIVRSQTRCDKDLLDAAKNLKIIGRAGVTVDNIDLEAASSRGIVVCNAPTSNIISTAEHTIALILAAARFIPQADKSIRENRWDRHKFLGTELYGKTLAIFGLGRVGSAVAERAKAFGMELVAYDPYCNPEKACQLGVTLYDDINEILPKADIITVHLPLTSETKGMFKANEFSLMKDGVILVNTARGGIYDINALADFVAAGKIAGAAIDVFEEEPCLESPLHSLDNVILTPHISAVTKEAQILAGTQIAEYVWAGLEGSIVPTALKISSLPPELLNEVYPYVPACKMVGRMLVELNGGIPKTLDVTLEGKLSDSDPNVIISGVVEGVITYKNVGEANLEDATDMAARHGMKITSTAKEFAEEYSSALTIKGDGVEIGTTLYGKDKLPRIISILGYKIDIAPSKQSLIFEYIDGPGRIGVIGTILGDAEINITTMQIGTKPDEQCALVYVNIEGEVTDKVIQKIKESIDLKNLWLVTL
jgi:D-3-phosphoglycerate dehydrogenase